MTDDKRGGAQHSSLAGNVPRLAASPGDKLDNVRIDLAKGWELHGTVKDTTGAPIPGVKVNAVYHTTVDGWAYPREFIVTDAKGEWKLYGIDETRFDDKDHPKVWAYKDGYLEDEKEFARGGGGSVDFVLMRTTK